MTIQKHGSQPRRQVHKYIWALNEMGTVTLDINGNGQFTLAPGGARERWLVTLINTTCTQPLSVKVPKLVVYRSSAVPSNQIGGTFTANLDTNSTDSFLLNMNEGMVFVYSGGDFGAVATIRIEGTRYVWE